LVAIHPSLNYQAQYGFIWLGIRSKKMKKRNLYDEINAGLNHLEQARLGNATLHSVQREMKAAVTIDAKEVKATREQARG
jgi:hypothetical protein